MTDKVTVYEIWTRERVWNRPGTGHTPCARCGKPFPQGSNKHPSQAVIWVCETRGSWFRGDDEVQFYHEKCSPCCTVGRHKVTP